MTEVETREEKAKGQPDERLKRQREAPEPPSVEELCLKHALYSKIQLHPARDDEYLGRLKFSWHQFDAYCVHCTRSSTFRSASDVPEDVERWEKLAKLNVNAKMQVQRLRLEGGQFALHLYCQRFPTHMYSYFFEYDPFQATLRKIGQNPSVEDIGAADLAKYRRILGTDYAELHRAGGLFAHGVGVGSFVYLRRTFEKLIYQAQQAADPEGLRTAEFKDMTMMKRVEALAAHLPEPVVRFRNAYGILSKGLHQLTEDECLKHFPIMRSAIIAMLEARYEAEEKKRAALELEHEFNRVYQDIAGPQSPPDQQSG